LQGELAIDDHIVIYKLVPLAFKGVEEELGERFTDMGALTAQK
jgi:hypothetical protein